MSCRQALKWTIIIILALVFVTCVTLSFLLTEDKMTLALISVVAVIFTVMGTVMMTCFFLEIKNIPDNECSNVQLRHQLQAAHMAFRHPNAPMILHAPPPRLISGDCAYIIPQISRPPSYEESADLENNRVQSFSNAPPAYNHLNAEESNNIASFSPPPFYRPATPLRSSETSMQTISLYFSPEQPSTSRTIHDTSATRVQSPLPERRKQQCSGLRRCPAVSYQVPSGVENLSSTSLPSSSSSSSNQCAIASTTPSSTTETTFSSPSVPKLNTSTTSVTHMFIDCSKAEPTMFTISRDESII